MTRNKPSILLGLGLALVLLALGAAFYASPYWSVHRMKEAARERDVEGLLARVDLGALRQSVRLALGFKLADALQDAQAQAGKAQAPGAQAMSEAQVDPLTQAITSPPLLLAMLIEGRPSRALTGADPSAADASPSGEWDTRLRYVDASTVQVRSAQAPQAGGFVFKRSGLFDWKLSGLLLAGE